MMSTGLSIYVKGSGYSKYRAKKCLCTHNHSHDSKKEAKRCDELHLLLLSGQIRDLELQKEYVLVPALKYSEPMKNERKVSYVADFVYFDNNLQKTVIEDCKGVRTKEYIIKRKLAKQLYCGTSRDIVFIET